MSLQEKLSNRHLVRDIAVILVIKVALLLTIKHIWFDKPTIPKNFNNQTAEHITGSSLQNKETR